MIMVDPQESMIIYANGTPVRGNGVPGSLRRRERQDGQAVVVRGDHVNRAGCGTEPLDKQVHGVIKQARNDNALTLGTRMWELGSEVPVAQGEQRSCPRARSCTSCRFALPAPIARTGRYGPSQR